MRREQDLETIMNSSLSTESWPQANSSLVMEEGNSSLWGLDYCLPPTTLVRWTFLYILLYSIKLLFSTSLSCQVGLDWTNQSYTVLDVGSRRCGFLELVVASAVASTEGLGVACDWVRVLIASGVCPS